MVENTVKWTPMRILLGVLLLIVIGTTVWWFFLRSRPAVLVEWQGYAEADYVKAGPTQQGLITAVHVARGDRVLQGASLFDQDDTFDTDAANQAARQLGAALDQLANLKSPSKPTEIAAADANLAEAVAARDKTQSDLTRNQKLLLKGYVTDQLVDQEAADLRSAGSKVLGLQAVLKQAQSPLGRDGEIRTQSAAVEAASAALAMARWRVAQRHVISPVSGVIADVLARPGETLVASAPVVSILPPANIFVRFFIPEPELPHVHSGDDVTLLCDTCPPDLKAKISFIAPQSEFTPPVIYSESTRGKLVFLAEARPAIEGAVLLNPGQPVTVRPHQQGNGP